MKKITLILIIIIAFVIFLGFSGVFYVVDERQIAIKTQFRQIVGEPITDAGLHFKKPFIQDVKRFDKRILEWDGDVDQIPTRDKLFILVDTFARWRINDAIKFYNTLNNINNALSKFDNILESETRNAVADHNLIEIIRSTKGRIPENALEIEDKTQQKFRFEKIKHGRPKIERQILTNATKKLDEFGVELLDIRFKRINYNPSVEKDIYDRMIAERQQIAERFRSEGQGEAAKIIGNMEKEVNRIESEAYKKVQIILGQSEAESVNIYASAYGKSSTASEFFAFTKNLQFYKKILSQNTNLILSTDSDLMNLLKTDKNAKNANIGISSQD